MPQVFDERKQLIPVLVERLREIAPVAVVAAEHGPAIRDHVPLLRCNNRLANLINGTAVTGSCGFAIGKAGATSNGPQRKARCTAVAPCTGPTATES